MIPVSREAAIIWADLARKATDDMQRVVSGTLELAKMVGGPSAMSSVLLHVCNTNILSLATMLDFARATEAGKSPFESSKVDADDYLFCCLFMAAAFLNRDGPAALIPMRAAEMYRLQTGREFNVPAAWMSATGPDDL